MTTDKSREALTTAAVHLDKARGLLVQVRDEGPGEWPEAMQNGEVAPSLEYRLYIDSRMLLEDFVEPGLALARDTSRLTDAKVTREWQAERGEATRLVEEMAARLPLDVNGDDYVPRFLAEVRKVMEAAHALRGKKVLTDQERITLSKAIRLQAVVFSEASLELYIARVLSEGVRLPELEESEDLQTPVREALVSLSQSALGLSAMLGRISGLGLDVGIEPETLASITEAIEELGRRVAVLEPTEDL